MSGSEAEIIEAVDAESAVVSGSEAKIIEAVDAESAVVSGSSHLRRAPS